MLRRPAWACLGLPGPAWAYLGLLGPTWAYLGLPGPTWAWPHHQSWTHVYPVYTIGVISHVSGQDKNSMPASTSEQLSLGLQFVASSCWAIGAALAGPAGAGDYLQLLAAVAWCLANLASAWSMSSSCCRGSSATVSPARGADSDKAAQKIETASRV